MTAKEAYNIFRKIRKDLVTISCHEYKTAFVFQAIPPKYVGTEEANKVFDSLYSIDKNTGQCRGFNPMLMPIEEYRNGKRVINFK
jgi:hypothetical protein